MVIAMVKLKHVIFILVFAMLLCMGVSSYASNEGISAVKGEGDEYLIYIHRS